MKKFISAVLVSAMMLTLLGSCQSGGGSSTASESGTSSESSVSSSETASESSEESSEAPSESSEEASSEVEKLGVEMNIAFLKGPTGLGALELMDANDKGETAVDYNISLVASADEIVSGIGSGEYDLAAAPTNLGSTLYNKTSGGVSIVAINTLGVLYVLEKGDVTVSTVEDLRGMDIIASGEGSTAEYVLDYILSENGIDPETDVNITYYTEHAEAATVLSSAENAVAVLPQPFVTTVMSQDEGVSIALDLTDEWEKVTDGAQLVMGSIIGRNEYIEANPEAVSAFLDEYAASTDFVNNSVEEAAALSESYDLFPAAVASKAIPNCNIVFMEGEEMKTSAESFLQVMYDYEPSTVGGTLPGDDFYFAR